MIAKLGQLLQRVAGRAVPDPFLLAVLLTGVVAIAGALTMASAGQTDIFWTLAGAWLTDFTAAPLLAFAFLMALVLVSGHALALTPAAQRFVHVVARLPRGPASSAALVAVVACAASIIHWGLGAIVGALLAREIGRDAIAHGKTVHYPLLGAAAYSGFAVWHGGLSGSAPVTVAAPGHFLADLLSPTIDGGVLPVSATLGSPLNLIITTGMLLTIAAVCFAITPADSECVPPDPLQLPPTPPDAQERPAGLLAALQHSRVTGAVFGTAATALVVIAIATGRATFSLNTVVLMFVFAGIALHGSLNTYAAAIADGARGAGAIILQFPFYFGILGIMKASGLVALLSNTLVALSTPTTFPVLAFLSAGLVNFFVPSGGGQWAVQGEILLSAGAAHGVNPVTTIMAFSYGDAWTNLLQPFWALPLLGIMGLRARDIIGYTAAVWLALGVLVPLGLLILG